MNPLGFHDRGVRGILDGNKTQTRRILRPQPSSCANGYLWWQGLGFDPHDLSGLAKRCFKAQPGETNYVQEAWRPYSETPGGGSIGIQYRADHAFRHATDFTHHQSDHLFNDWEDDFIKAGSPGKDDYDRDEVCQWRDENTLPAWASRIHLPITSVRVERVQDISEADAYAEGVSRDDPSQSPIAAFAHLWNDTYGPGSWNRNDWVWVIEWEQPTIL